MTLYVSWASHSSDVVIRGRPFISRWELFFQIFGFCLYLFLFVVRVVQWDPTRPTVVCDVGSNPVIATFALLSTPNRSVSYHGGSDKPYIYLHSASVCVVITFSRLGINRVWLPILLVVS